MDTPRTTARTKEKEESGRRVTRTFPLRCLAEKTHRRIWLSGQTLRARPNNRIQRTRAHLCGEAQSTITNTEERSSFRLSVLEKCPKTLPAVPCRSRGGMTVGGLRYQHRTFRVQESCFQTGLTGSSRALLKSRQIQCQLNQRQSAAHGLNQHGLLGYTSYYNNA
jgi:hypothetical protein